MQWLLIFSCVFGLYFLSSIYTLVNNYLIARKTGFHLDFCPVNPNNPLWMIFSIPLRPVFSNFLPSFAYEWVRRAIYGWEFQERSTTGSSRTKPAFMLVTPGRNELWIEDADLGNMVLTRRKDFVQFDIASSMVSLLMRCLSN
jgi:hypothetical protein